MRFWAVARWTLILALLFLGGGCSTAHKEASTTAFNVQELGVVRDVLPLAVQPDPAKWRRLQVGMTEGQVVALLGYPYRKDARPAPTTDPNLLRLYCWYYGEISFQSFMTKGAHYYAVYFHEGLVHEIRDPWNGQFSPDGRPTVPELVLPGAGQTLHHYPRFLDFRWQPASGVYPIEYEVEIQALTVSQQESEHFEDYITKTVAQNREQWIKDGMSQRDMTKMAADFAQELRRDQAVVSSWRFRTHDIYVPLTWVGSNTGRWRVRGENAQGVGDWTAWRYFAFSR